MSMVTNWMRLQRSSPKCVEGLGALALCGPDDAALEVVQHQGDVLAVLPVRDLVDADHVELVEAFSVLEVRHDSRDDPAERPPVDAHHVHDRGLVGPLNHPGDHLVEVLGEVAVVVGPGDCLDDDPTTLRAVDASRPVAEPELEAAEVQVTPMARLLGPVVLTRDLCPADSAPWLSPPRLDVEHEPIARAIEFRILDDNPPDTEDFLEYNCCAHGDLPVGSLFANPILRKVCPGIA